MKNAHESLADVRRWICDNLSNGDAGKLCNMLSSVSRHISEIEIKNEHLRCNYVDKIEYISALEQKIICMDDENAKLRELARKMLKPFYWAQSGYEVCLSDEEDREIRDMLRELEIEVPDAG